MLVSLATSTPTVDEQGDIIEGEIDIYTRMEYLSYAVYSGTSAMTNPVRDASIISAVLTGDHVTNINDQLTVASE